MLNTISPPECVQLREVLLYIARPQFIAYKVSYEASTSCREKEVRNIFDTTNITPIGRDIMRHAV